MSKKPGAVHSLLVIFIASFFGIEAVAASAFLTLPLQAFVALAFVSRRIDLHPRELAGAMGKSAVVAVSTALGVILILGINDFNLAISIFGFFGASLAAMGGWCLGLVVTRHPLLNQLRLALTRSRFDRLMELLGSQSIRRRAEVAQPRL